VEYSLTPLGWTMTEPLIALSEWGEAHASDVSLARTRFQGDAVTVKEQPAAA